VTPELAAFVMGRLAGDRVRAMFGGWGIYRDGEMVAIVYDGRTYIKVATEAAQRRFVAAGMGPFQPRPRQTLKSFWEIPPEVLHDAGQLATWTGHPE
jgi:DNA transformation protein and related proteins